MSAPIASETRSPLRASSETSACSDAGPRPAATSRAPTPRSLDSWLRWRLHPASRCYAPSVLPARSTVIVYTPSGT